MIQVLEKSCNFIFTFLYEPCKYKTRISFFWHSSKYERNGSRAKLTWRYFARDPLRSYFDECQKNEIYFVIIHLFINTGKGIKPEWLETI